MESTNILAIVGILISMAALSFSAKAILEAKKALAQEQFLELQIKLARISGNNKKSEIGCYNLNVSKNRIIEIKNISDIILVV